MQGSSNAHTNRQVFNLEYYIATIIKLFSVMALHGYLII